MHKATQESEADPDFELRGGPGLVLLALPAFLPSVMSSFFTQNKGPPPPPPPPLLLLLEISKLYFLFF